MLSANGYYYKVVNPRTIIVIPDQPAKHTQYDELVVRVFYISHADATELAQIVNTIMRIPQLPLPPMVMPNKTANTITVRATAPVVDVIDRIIRANDKPRAEVVLDVEILEVDRERIKRYGINLSQYNLNLLFSPEVAPPNTAGGAVAAPPPFNLNTISQGVSTADFYLGVPTAVVNFLESDSHSRTLAKPQLRGTEGQKMTLNLGSAGAGHLDRVRRRRGRRLRDDSAVVLQLQGRRREHGHHAAGDLRRRGHPRPGAREQLARTERRRRRAEHSVVQFAQGRDASAAAGRGVEPARRPDRRGRAPSRFRAFRG